MTTLIQDLEALIAKHKSELESEGVDGFLTDALSEIKFNHTDDDLSQRVADRETRALLSYFRTGA